MTRDNSEKALRTYAYLTAYLRTDASVGDIYDCLLPFLQNAISARPSDPVTPDRLATDLKEVGLEIPVYAVQQLLPRLVNRGFVEWNSIAKQFLPIVQSERVETETLTLPDSFEQIEPMLVNHAKRLGLDAPPISDTWSDALISFLKNNYSGNNIKAFQFKDTIIANTAEKQEYVVATFLAHIAGGSPETFDHIVRIYTGIQIEDFIGNVQTLQRSTDFNGLTVYYDTAVLLRMLGTSGHLHHDATLEMHHSLQSLGAKTYYLGSIGAEVENILNSITSAYERGYEIYNETSDAIVNGEISIAQIKDLAATFEARLATMNIYQQDYDYTLRKTEEYYQISEDDFAEALKSGAMIAERGYSNQNAYNDAKAVAIVLRLRKGRSARDVGRSFVVFVTKNRLLQRVARQFAIKHTDAYDESSVPPVFTDGQITMAAWLGSGKGLPPAKVTKELLAKCYSAVQPSPEWMDAFADALTEFQAENPEAVTDRANHIIFLRAAKNVARDASLNDASVLKKLNVAEIFRQAQDRAIEDEKAKLALLDFHKKEHSEELSKLDRVHRKEMERQKEEAEIEFERVMSSRVTEAEVTAKREARESLLKRHSHFAETAARWIVAAFYLFIALVAAWSLIFGIDVGHEGDTVRWIMLTIAFLITVLALLDLGGFGYVRTVVDRLRGYISRKIVSILGAFSDE